MALVATRDLIKKLLHLYPVKFLKEHYNQTGSQNDIIEILSSNSINNIVEFCVLFHGTTKQTIYNFTLNRNFNSITDMSNFPFDIALYQTMNNLHTYVIFPETIYSVYLNNPPQREDICFIKPVLIEINGSNVTMRFTKLKKDIKTYYPIAKEPKIARETGSESQTLSEIIRYFSNSIGIGVNDLNRGVKFLWETDILDCRKVSYKDANSTTLTTMNGELTYKQQYRDKYEDMKHTPIGESSWIFLQEDTEIVREFKCNPSSGTLDFNKYSENVNQINNVVNRILEQN